VDVMRRRVLELERGVSTVWGSLITSTRLTLDLDLLLCASVCAFIVKASRAPPPPPPRVYVPSQGKAYETVRG